MQKSGSGTPKTYGSGTLLQTHRSIKLKVYFISQGDVGPCQNVEQNFTTSATYKKMKQCCVSRLKGHGNETDFLGFLHISVPHESLTYGESTTPRIVESGSRQLRGSVIRGVDNSADRWYRESTTPRIGDTGSRQLRGSVIRGVDNSADRWYGESLFKEKINLVSIFRAFNG